MGEDGRVIVVCARRLVGVLDRTVVATVSTVDGTSQGLKIIDH